MSQQSSCSLPVLCLTLANTFTDHSHQGDDELDDDETWDKISREEAPQENVNPPTTNNPYLQFQLRTRLGHFSFELKTTTTTIPDAKQTMLEDKTINPQTSSPFFHHLPAEIRLQIYELVLYVPPPAGQTCIFLSKHYHSTPSVLTLLETCRLIFSEAETIFYSINRLCCSPNYTSWKAVNIRRRAAVTMFELPAGDAARIHEGLVMLRKQCPNLKSLFLRRNQSVKFTHAGTWAIMANQIRTELEGMKELRELKIFVPEAKDLSQADIERQKKLDGIDESLYDVVRRRKAAEGEK